MTDRSVAHTSFTIVRDMAASPAEVFRAWADPEAKRRWTGCHPEMTREHHLDFRPGGLEINRMTGPDGAVFLVEARFIEILPDQRIIYAYDYRVGDQRTSASLVTVEFDPGGRGTKMAFTEQVAFLDGHDERDERIHGTNEGFDRLELDLLGALTRQ
ncbi:MULTISPECIES: SRPBCC family protein [unclassified Phenylobacterium]|uniref:SRPBCC family protein n=1 Tax=unclassified Phenylobacterium TaxID=2640670 RepID=UPI00083A7D0F|nr:MULTISPECIES: SRPBCC family protein [unclassified Phenylobacterium]